ncbi:MAG: hypothetical protein Unbinned6747contig1000_39 [Prokaryotic dsDNA virus sp.]|nr:MAG: hypothetical protein Unbinned6747contig1000_39 [Prokaryotic dsDNA virus sp.]|tara:strand:+ start:8268 stop:11255 length:2988 start_codon:yes stop_codon:yes gene_type:complete
MSLSPSANYTGASYLSNIKENWLFQLYNQDSYLQFDGTDDFIDCGTTSSAISGITSNITIAFWINFPSSVIGESIPDYIFMSNSIADYFTGFNIYKDQDDKISILVSDGGNDNDYKRIRGDVVSADTWYFVAITSDLDGSFDTLANTTILYNNSGTTESAADSSWSASKSVGYSGSGKTLFGKFLKPDPDGFAEFKLKNFAIWNVQLDSNNLTAIYNSGNFLSLEEDSGNYNQSSNLKAYWEFNNGENFAQDLTGNIATGTISGAKYKGFLPIAFRDTTVDDIFYHGVVKSNPSIRDSIDVLKSKSKVGNLSLKIINSKYQGSDISKELFGGSNNYYNRTVKVYSQLNELNNITDCLQLYHGRLTNISHDDASINLSIVQKSPWDNKVVPDIQSETGRKFPIIYGAYTPNSSGYTSEAYAEAMGQLVFPVEVDIWGYNYECLLHKDIGSTDTTLHYYEESVDAFLPLANSNDAVAYGDGYVARTKWDLTRHFKFKPIDTVVRASGWDSSYQIGNAFDGIADQDSTTTPSTYAQFDYEYPTADTQSQNTVNQWDVDTHFNIPGFDDFFYSSGSGSNNLTCEVRWTMTNFYAVQNSDTSGAGGFSANTFKITDNGRHGGSVIKATAAGISNGATFTNGSYSDLNAFSSGTKVTISERTASRDMLDDLIQYKYDDGFWIRFERSATRHGDVTGGTNVGIYGVLKVYDIRFLTTLKVPTFNTTAEGMKRLKDVKKLYSGADGLTASWDNSAITLGHQAHRDLLIRYAGMPTIEPENWNYLIYDRASWGIRHWQHEEISLIKYLEKLQYEFGFIHKVSATGVSKYIWIHGTDTNNVLRAEDVVATLKKEDISSLNISTTSINEIVTKAVINTNRHPAKENYLTQTTAVNSTPRTKYNIKSKENVSTINLDALTLAPATTPANDKQSDFYSYYSQANGDTKKIISCNVVNMQKGYLLEVGDVIKFDNMPVEPFASDWSNYYMVVELVRSAGKIKIKAREIG